MARFTFIALALAIGAFIYAGLQVPRDSLPMRVLRNALFIGAGLFGALLVSAMLQALLATD